jgi:uncharacterized membrane protein YkoI
MPLRKSILMAAAAALTMGTLGSAFAAEDKEIKDQDEARAVLGASTSLVQAIQTAEQQTGGKAIGSGVSQENGAFAYQIEVAKGEARQDVVVDMQSGRVLKVADAVAYQEGDGENEEE